ncbi:hypothetical protein BC830DRAFT_1167956 [Chytriomyces sp. MP71]|nr:hypothetical protein BC830DRAFT_1167956 [Chytriomyces sp. MP71]
MEVHSAPTHSAHADDTKVSGKRGASTDAASLLGSAPVSVVGASDSMSPPPPAANGSASTPEFADSGVPAELDDTVALKVAAADLVSVSVSKKTKMHAQAPTPYKLWLASLNLNLRDKARIAALFAEKEKADSGFQARVAQARCSVKQRSQLQIWWHCLSATERKVVILSLLKMLRLNFTQPFIDRSAELALNPSNLSQESVAPPSLEAKYFPEVSAFQDATPPQENLETVFISGIADVVKSRKRVKIECNVIPETTPITSVKSEDNSPSLCIPVSSKPLALASTALQSAAFGAGPSISPSPTPKLLDSLHQHQYPFFLAPGFTGKQPTSSYFDLDQLLNNNAIMVGSQQSNLQNQYFPPLSTSQFIAHPQMLFPSFNGVPGMHQNPYFHQFINPLALPHHVFPSATLPHFSATLFHPTILNPWATHCWNSSPSNPLQQQDPPLNVAPTPSIAPAPQPTLISSTSMASDAPEFPRAPRPDGQVPEWDPTLSSMRSAEDERALQEHAECMMELLREVDGAGTGLLIGAAQSAEPVGDSQATLWKNPVVLGCSAEEGDGGGIIAEWADKKRKLEDDEPELEFCCVGGGGGKFGGVIPAFVPDQEL